MGPRKENEVSEATTVAAAAVAGEVVSAAQGVLGAVLGAPAEEKPKRTRKPRAQKPPKKQRIRGAFAFFKKEADGKYSDMGVDGGSTYESALRVLRTFAAGEYLIVRNYGVKTVSVEQITKTVVA